MVNILIVDDHPLIVEGYRNILLSSDKAEQFKILHACNCESAHEYLTQNIEPFDVVLLDFALPPFEEQKLLSGEDLARFIRKQSPKTKVMMLTSHTEAFVIYQLSKKVNPEALMIKCDFNPDELLFAFETVLSGQTYYSITTRTAIKEVSKNHDFLDAYDRRIISLLAKGIKTKNLPDHLGISVSAIDKRKAKIKDYFNIEKGNDEDIIHFAQKRGLI